MADNPPPTRGRGAALLEALRRRQEKERTQVGEAPPLLTEEPPKPRGRADLLKKLRDSRAAKVGVQTGGSTVGPGGDAPSSAPSQPERKVEQITKTMEEFSISAPEKKLYRGDSGKPLNICANYIRLKLEKDRGVFEYEVKFDPPLDAKSMRIRLVNTLMREIGSVKVFDGGSMLYLPSQITDTQQSFKGNLPTIEEDITMTLIFKRKRHMHECLQVYNVLFKRIMYILLYTQMGKNYFDPVNKFVVPQHKLEVFPGYAVAVDEMEGGLMLCLDTQHRVLRSQNVHALLNELHSTDPHRFKELAQANIIGSCVFTRYNNKTYIVDDIVWDMAPTDTFPTRDGSAISFIDYYKKQYDITIYDPGQPLLLNRKSIKKTGTLEKQDQMILLIPELSYLTGLSDAMRSDFKVMKDVGQHTRVTPHQRRAALLKYIERVKKSDKAQELLGSWGLQLDNGAIDIQARVLEPEVLYFGGEVSHRCNANADWSRAASENRVTGPVDLRKWIVFHTARDGRYAKDFSQMMVKLGPAMGIEINPPNIVMLKDDRNESYIAACKQYIADSVQVVVFICPTLRGDRYGIIKKICCADMPIASQVILSKTLSRPDKCRSIIQKIAMQINCKLGGSLWTARFPFKGWMICGIDVYHGARDKSVCGFVASINESVSRWYSTGIFQHQELGDFFRATFSKALEQYKLTMGNFPSKVIIYRDGVGDSQLDHSLRYEVTQFEDVLASFKLDTKICFIVVQKRINTRIFAKVDSYDKSCDNPPPGTILDNTVTRRFLYDFYLVSQNVRQGTVNPTHYIVLYDKCDIKPDHIQRLSHKLCHLYYNWSGTIRVPAPCLYAHKLASLVGQHMQKAPSAALSTRLYYL